MKVPLSLLLLLMVVAFVAMTYRVEGEHMLELVTAMTVGFLMIGAWLTGRCFDQIGLPRVSGYLLFGMLVGPAAWVTLWQHLAPASIRDLLERGMPLVSEELVGQEQGRLRLVKDLAISLIAITAGGEIRLEWLRGRLKSVTALVLASVLVVGTLVAGVGAAIHFAGVPLFGSLEMTTTQALVVFALLGLIASGNSPSVAIAMINECRAAGPLSQTTLVVTVCKDLLIILLFASLAAIGGAVLESKEALSPRFLLVVGVELGGSLGVGAALGLVMAWFVEHVRGHLVFFIVGSCFLFALLGEQHFMVDGKNAHLHPLLMALMAGLTMRNFRPMDSSPLFHAIEELSLPIYCLFFAVAGAELDLSVFFRSHELLIAVLAVVGLRTLAVWGVIGGTARWLGLDEQWRGKLWLCLLPQAGVTLALTLLAVKTLPPEVAGPFKSLLMGLVIIHALFGPIAYRWALIRSGEAGKADEMEPMTVREV